MIKEIKNHTSPVWAIAHDSNSVFHPAKLEVGQIMTTPQPFLERFDTEEDMLDRLIELAGNTHAWQNPSLEIE
jgi:hypothetical protein